jgi:recombination protein RecA
MADERVNKNKAIDIALTQIEKQFGKGSIMRLGDRVDTGGVQSISTGSISFDAALGVGGFPKGRVVEIFGPESSGKTTISLHAIAQAQKAGGSAAFIDAEHAMDAGYAKMLGVDTDELLVSQPDRRWRLRRSWFAVAPSIFSWWILSPPWSRRRSWKVKWAIHCRDCRRD